MKPAFIALLAAAGALAACADENAPQAAAAAGSSATPAAEVGPAPRDNCFLTRDITGHTIVNDRTLLIRTRSNAIFRVEMSGSCLAGRSSSDPLIIRQPPGLQTVCRPLDLDISIGSSGMPPSIRPGAFASRCIPSTLTRLTPAEVAALPPRQRP